MHSSYLKKGKLYTLHPDSPTVWLAKATRDENGYRINTTSIKRLWSRSIVSGEDWLIFLDSREPTSVGYSYYYFLWENGIWEYRVNGLSQCKFVRQEEWQSLTQG